eukprot:4145049-Amphidinium_carterae.2
MSAAFGTQPEPFFWQHNLAGLQADTRVMANSLQRASTRKSRSLGVLRHEAEITGQLADEISVGCAQRSRPLRGVFGGAGPIREL